MFNDAATIVAPSATLSIPSATLPIPDGSFIVGSPTAHYDPEMVAVGPPTACLNPPNCQGASVAFLSDTYGHLSSSALLFDSKSWEIPIGRVLHEGMTQTAEFSTNLQWNANGDFYYVDPSLGHPAMDQGLALRPDYSLPNP